MGRNTQQVKKVFIGSAFLIMIILFLVQWIPFLIFSITPDLDSNNLVSYIIDNYSYTGFKGVLIAGIAALAMSTADSILNSSAVLFAHDFCCPLKLKPKNELLASKLFSIILGVIGVVLALYTKDILQIILDTSSFYMPIVTIPMMLTILGFRTTTRAVLIGMTAGFITIIIWNLLEIKIDPIAFAMLINLAFLLGSHYFLKENGGWISNKPKLNTLIKHKFTFWTLKNYYQFNFIKYYTKNSPTNELSYVSLGIYFIIFTISTMYNTQTCLIREDCKWILYLYQVMMTCGVLLAIYPIWPTNISQKTKQITAQILWPILIFFILIVCNSFFVLISSFNSLQFAVFTVNLLIVATLLRWCIAIFLILAGSYISITLYNHFAINQFFNYNMESPAFISIYLLVLSGAAIVLFLKPKQQQHEATEAEVGALKTEVTHLDHEMAYLATEVTDLNEKVDHYSERISDQEREIERLGATAQKILNNVNHELRLPVGNVMNFAEMLNEGLGNFNESQLKMLSDEVYKNSNRISSMIMNMLDLAALSTKELALDKKTINLGELVSDRVKNCRKVYLDGKKIDFILEIQPELLISIDPDYMRQVVDNLVINAIKFSSEGVVNIKLLQMKNHLEFTISDNGIGIPQADLYDIFTPFKMGSNTESKAEGRGVGLALCRAAIEAHGGSITADSKGGKGAIFKFVLSL
jgi:signal transduction histidine kinase